MPLPAELDFAFRLSVPRANTFFTDYEKKAVNRVPRKAGARSVASAVRFQDLSWPGHG